jgi:RNA polymerase sigma-70 factor (ECF subfamily)
VGLKAVQAQLVTFLPNLRAFAISLCGNPDLADDLVQDTILKAWASLGLFEEGTNLRAWLFTILRNNYFSLLRRRRNETSIDETYDVAAHPNSAPEQEIWMDSKDLLKALAQVPASQREAIILVGAEGFSYEEAAQVCGCPVGTIKSRVNRARVRLDELLNAAQRPCTAPAADAAEPSSSSD